MSDNWKGDPCLSMYRGFFHENDSFRIGYAIVCYCIRTFVGIHFKTEAFCLLLIYF